MRRKAKIDAAQTGIVEALRDIPGVTVKPGHDDILVGYQKKTFWYEIKSPSAISKRTGTVLHNRKQKSQVKLESDWKGHYRIVSTLDEILVDMMLRNARTNGG